MNYGFGVGGDDGSIDGPITNIFMNVYVACRVSGQTNVNSYSVVKIPCLKKNSE